MADMSKFGYSVTALMRDMLIATGKFDFMEAIKFSEAFDQRIVESDFLFTLNGTTFDKNFVPKG